MVERGCEPRTAMSHPAVAGPEGWLGELRIAMSAGWPRFVRPVRSPSGMAVALSPLPCPHMQGSIRADQLQYTLRALAAGIRAGNAKSPICLSGSVGA
jgi:hypothetical protein